MCTRALLMHLMLYGCLVSNMYGLLNQMAIFSVGLYPFQNL